MIRKISILALTLLSANALAANVASTEAAHTSLHRAERLIALKQLDPSFMTEFVSETVETLTQAKPTDPAYRVALQQAADKDGNPRVVNLLTDGNGKEISHTVNSAGPAVAAAHFTGNDPITLTEYAYHYLIAKGDAAKPGAISELEPYYTGLVSVSITKGKTAAGAEAGLVDFVAAKEARKLRIVMTPDLQVVTYQFVDKE